MKKAFFFDRDGIVNQRLVGDYVTRSADFTFIEDFFALFQLARSRDFLCIIVSNQQGVAKGLMKSTDLQHITDEFLQVILKRCGSTFDDVFYCTDLDNAGSTRRKPEPGMLLEAAEKWHIDLTSSWMIGDSISDVIAGHRAGTRTILVGDFADVAEATWIVPDLKSAYRIVQEYCL